MHESTPFLGYSGMQQVWCWLSGLGAACTHPGLLQGVPPSMRSVLHVSNAQPAVPAAQGHLPPRSHLQPPLTGLSHLLGSVTCLSLKPGIFGLKTDLESDKI